MPRNPLRALFGREKRSSTSWMNALMDGTAIFKTRSGVTVNTDTALSSTAVLACLIVRAETFATLPVHVFRKVGDTRTQVSDHVLAELVSNHANPMMTSAEFWRWVRLTVDIRGNAYVRVEWSGEKPVALWPLTSAEMQLRWEPSTRTIAYEYGGDTVTAKGEYLGGYGSSRPEILHFKGPMVQGAWAGTSLVEKAAEAIGLTMATERFYARLLGNGTHFPGYLQTDQPLRQEDVDALGEQFASNKGVEHAGEIRIFDRGIKWQTNPMTIKDADLTAQQLFYLQQVCRVFRVPPSMVQDWSHSTYTNSEQADLWFAKHTILPIATDTERTVGALLAARGERDHYVKFGLDGLLRGDFKTRSEGYSILVNSGVMTRNEARQLEDWNPVNGLSDPLRPLNTAVVDPSTGMDREAMASEPEAQVDMDPQRGIHSLVDDAVRRIRERAAQDEARGRDSAATIEFARRVLAPFAQAWSDFPVEATIRQALEADHE